MSEERIVKALESIAESLKTLEQREAKCTHTFDLEGMCSKCYRYYFDLEEITE